MKGEKSSMEDDKLVPCVNWQKKLAALHMDGLSPAEREALNAHMVGCPWCTAAFDDKMDSLIHKVSVSESPLELPDWLTQNDLAAKLPPLPAHRQYQNLPPRFEGFLGRGIDLEYIAEGLNSFHTLLTIEGGGGVGKTTLAVEVAHQCLRGLDIMPNTLFKAAVWISARGRLNQELWLHEILDTIARVLDYPSVAQLPSDEKYTRVNELLHAYQALVIIDNLDTIVDPDLLTWIQQIPEPSKVLVTSRNAHQFHQAWTLHLKGLEEGDALEFIRNHAEDLELPAIGSMEEVRELVGITCGNPQAITMVLGSLKSDELSLHQVLDGLRNAEDILGHLFMRSWAVLDGSLHAQHTLLVMSFFVSSASQEALSAVVGIHDPQLERALIRLAELSLIEVYSGQGGAQARYALHPLARAFIETKLKEVPNWEQDARNRWVEWWLAFTKEHGGLDGMEWAQQYNLIEKEWKNLLAVCKWCETHDQYEALRAFWSTDRLLWMTSIYGYWKERLYWLGWIGHEAQRRGDKATEIESMVERGFTLTQMGLVEEAGKMLNEAWNQRDLVGLEVQAALAENLIQWHIRTNDFAGTQLWLEKADRLVSTPGLSEFELPRHQLTLKYYCGVMYIAKGDRDQAERYFRETLAGAQEIGWQRGMIYVQQFLADIVKARGRFGEAEKLLKTGLEVAKRNKDKRRTAYYQRSLAYLILQQERRNKLGEVINWARQALDGFEHLGMKPEVNKLRRLLGHLEAVLSSPSVEEVSQEQTSVDSGSVSLGDTHRDPDGPPLDPFLGEHGSVEPSLKESYYEFSLSEPQAA
jgi:LuxR family glucitol operon transcriptional activator